MKDEEASRPQDELARLRQENARLHAMIDHLERERGDEPAGLAADTQIIRADPEMPTPARRARSVERPKRQRKRRKREHEEESPFRGCLLAILTIGGICGTYAGLLILAIVQSDEMRVMNAWYWIATSLLAGLCILGVLAAIGALIVSFLGERKERVERQVKRHAQALKRRAHRASSHRITHKLRAATTQKLSEDDC